MAAGLWGEPTAQVIGRLLFGLPGCVLVLVSTFMPAIVLATLTFVVLGVEWFVLREKTQALHPVPEVGGAVVVQLGRYWVWLFGLVSVLCALVAVARLLSLLVQAGSPEVYLRALHTVSDSLVHSLLLAAIGASALTVLGFFVGYLSGGQQQRIALARALVLQPKALLMDEPLSNFDEELSQHLRGELLGLYERLGFTLIYVTHDRAEAGDIAMPVAISSQNVLFPRLGRWLLVPNRSRPNH